MKTGARFRCCYPVIEPGYSLIVGACHELNPYLSKALPKTGIGFHPSMYTGTGNDHFWSGI
jgi:hypothetical protein